METGRRGILPACFSEMNLQVLKILENVTREEMEGVHVIDADNLPRDFGTECYFESRIPVDTPELRLWRGPAGLVYTIQNSAYKPQREVVFREFLGSLFVKNILEVGCNVGNNLAYFVKHGIRAYGIDPIRPVLEDSYFLGAQATAFALPFMARQFDMVLCAGVLCHISKDYLSVALKEIERVVGKYAIIIDYHSDEEKAIPFRGTSLCWGRDFTREVMAHTGLELVRSGFTNQWNGNADYKFTLWEKN